MATPTTDATTDYLSQNLGLKNAFASSHLVTAHKTGCERDTEADEVTDLPTDADEPVLSIKISPGPPTASQDWIPAVVSLRTHDETNQRQPYQAYTKQCPHSDVALILRQWREGSVVQQTFSPAGSEHTITYPSRDDKTTISIWGDTNNGTALYDEKDQESVLHFWRDVKALPTDGHYKRILSHPSGMTIRSQEKFDIYGYVRYIPQLILSDNEEDPGQGAKGEGEDAGYEGGGGPSDGTS